MTTQRKNRSDAVNRSNAACDKSRNEQQKSILLKVLAATKHQAKFSQLSQESRRILQKSKDLCDKARKLVSEKKDLRQQSVELQGKLKKLKNKLSSRQKQTSQRRSGGTR